MSITSIMRHKVTIERKNTVSDATGGVVEQWSAYLVDVDAFVQPRSGSEAYNQGFDFSRTTAVIYIANVNGQPVDVTASDRIVHEGVTYIMRAAPRPDRWEYVRCECEQLS